MSSNIVSVSISGEGELLSIDPDSNASCVITDLCPGSCNGAVEKHTGESWARRRRKGRRGGRKGKDGKKGGGGKEGGGRGGKEEGDEREEKVVNLGLALKDERN